MIKITYCCDLCGFDINPKFRKGITIILIKDEEVNNNHLSIVKTGLWPHTLKKGEKLRHMCPACVDCIKEH